MSQSPPPPVRMDYQSPGSSPPPRSRFSTAKQMFIGLGAGTLVSAIVWVGGWKYIDSGKGASAIVVVPLLKLIVGVVLLCMPGLRGFGGGVLMSIALGFLIFFVTCAANFKM